METSELTLLDLLSFVKKLKVYVRSEVEKYVDEKAKEIKDKDKAATYITNKVLNNMVGNKPLDASKVDELKAGKPKRVVKNKYTKVQNREVIKALFIGKILVWDRPDSGQKYEIKVEGVDKFVDNKTGKVIEAKSLSGVCIALAGGGSYSGWEELEVCLDPKEELQPLKYYRKNFCQLKIVTFKLHIKAFKEVLVYLLHYFLYYQKLL
ncbi:MAG: hypothetical protein LBC06_03555 [Rickettsiales bacterium]|jgi:hypothetical protein|nr:hypothetical protein [Rickettsiales bacterium]